MADRQGVHRLVYPSANSLHSDFIDSSSSEFIAIGRKMVSNLVSNLLRARYPPRVPYTPYWVTVYVPSQRLGFWSVNFAECVSKGAVDSFIYLGREDYLCILLIRGFCYYIITPSSKKRENSVGSIGKSEKSPEKIL